MTSSRRFTAMSPITSTAITRFQFGDLCFVLTEGIEIGEDHVAFDGPGVARAKMVRVCVHPAHRFPDRFGFAQAAMAVVQRRENRSAHSVQRAWLRAARSMRARESMTAPEARIM